VPVTVAGIATTPWAGKTVRTLELAAAKVRQGAGFDQFAIANDLQLHY
jgi:hypothetical protein